MSSLIVPVFSGLDPQSLNQPVLHLSSQKFAHIHCYTPATWTVLLSLFFQQCRSSVTPACVPGWPEAALLSPCLIISGVIHAPNICILCLWPLFTATCLKCGTKYQFLTDLNLKLFSFQLYCVSIDKYWLKNTWFCHGSLKKTKLGTSRHQNQTFFFIVSSQFLQVLRYMQKFWIYILISEKTVKYGGLSILSCLKRKWHQVVPEEAQIRY